MAELNISDDLIEQWAKLAEVSNRTPEELLAEWIEDTENQSVLENIHELVLANISDAVFVTRDNGDFTYVCPNIKKTLGYSVPEMESLGNSSALGFDGLFELSELKRIGEIQNIEWRIYDRSGNKHDLLVNVKHVSLGKGTVLYTCRDISSRKMMEEALRESEERYRSLVELSPDTLVIYAEGKLLYINEIGAREFARVSHPDEVIGKNIADLVHPEYQAALSTSIMQTMEPQRSERRRAEEEVILRDGSQKSIEVSSTPIQFEGKAARYVIVRDITERKADEHHLQLQSRLLNAVQQAVIATDSDGTVTYWNEYATRLYGWTEAEALNQNILNLNVPKMAESQATNIMTQLRQGQSWSGKFMVKRRDGSEFPALVTNSPILNQRGELEGIIGLSFDITESEQAAAALARQAVRAEAYAEISRLIAEARLDYPTVLDIVVKKIATLIGDACVIALATPDRQAVEPVAFHHPNAETHAYMHDLFATNKLNQSDMLVSILATGQPVLSPDLTKEEARGLLPVEYHDYVNQHGVHSILIVPLQAQGQIIGTLGVTRDSPGRPYSLNDQTFLQNLGDRVALAIQNARLFEEVRGGREQMRQLARKIVTAQEDERRRIAYELHDEAGQALTALKIILQMIEQDVPEALRDFRARLAETVELADTTVEFIRLLAQDLRPPALDAMGLDTVLESYCHHFAERTRIQTHYHGQNIVSLSDTISLNLYRFLQEALTNVAKHAQASSVQVRLASHDDTVQLSVADNGRGFDTRQIVRDQQPSQGMGLASMRERIELMGGRFDIQSVPGSGTSLSITMPLRSGII